MVAVPVPRINTCDLPQGEYLVLTRVFSETRHSDESEHGLTLFARLSLHFL
jgi:hypothetical protein